MLENKATTIPKKKYEKKRRKIPDSIKFINYRDSI